MQAIVQLVPTEALPVDLDFGTEEETDRKISCTRKVSHSTEADAQKAAAAFGKRKRAVFEAYKCRHCEFWHVGSPNGREMKK